MSISLYYDKQKREPEKAGSLFERWVLFSLVLFLEEKEKIEGVGKENEREQKRCQNLRDCRNILLFDKDAHCIENAVGGDGNQQALRPDVYHHKKEACRRSVHNLKKVCEKTDARTVE